MEIKTRKDHYLIDGVKYDRVTSVLDYFQPKPLVDWKQKMGSGAKGVSTAAKQIGTRVDGIVQKIVTGKPWALTDQDCPAVRHCIKAFQDWQEAEGVRVLDTQLTTYSDKYMIAGTADMISDAMVLDIKCSKRISPNYWLQVACYAKMIWTVPIPVKLAILRLDKLTADYEYKVIPYDERLWNIYLGILNRYRFHKGYDKKAKVELNEMEKVSFNGEFNI